MRAQAQAVTVANAHAGGNHVIHQARELINVAHAQVAQLAQTNRQLLELGGKHRAVVSPRNIRQGTEQAVQVQLVGANQSVGEQVQTQVRVDRVFGCLIQVDGCGTHLGAGIARRVLSGQVLQLVRDGQVGSLGEGGSGEPRIQDGAGVLARDNNIDQCDAGGVTGSVFRHASHYSFGGESPFKTVSYARYGSCGRGCVYRGTCKVEG